MLFLENISCHHALFIEDIYAFGGGLIWLMVFNATFNNISVIAWQSVLLVEETGVSGKNH